MGAPAGSGEVSIFTWPQETGCFWSSSRNPVIAKVAGDPTERFLIASQVPASPDPPLSHRSHRHRGCPADQEPFPHRRLAPPPLSRRPADRKSTRLNSSHFGI